LRKGGALRKPYEVITRVPLKALLPHATELVLRCESCEKAAKYANIGIGTIYRIVIYREYDTVQLEIARKILDALIRKRKEDRLRGKTSQQYHSSRRLQAIVEERIERDYSKEKL
jgi:hypothetical protein